MLAIGKKLTPEQRLIKGTGDIIGNNDYVALAGVLMIGSKKISTKTKTASTNGRDEAYNPDFIDTLTDAEFRFVIMHECYHKMYQHLVTYKDLSKIDHERANRACDYVINLKLMDEDNTGFIKLPKCALYDAQYRGMSAREVFKLLPPSGSEDGDGDGNGGSPFDDHEWDEAEALSDEDKEDLAKQIDEAVRQGSILAGKLGSGGNRTLEDLLETKQNWKELLRDFVTTVCTGRDYSSWKRPNRRYIGLDIIMPSGISETMGEVLIGADTSGSIGNEALASFLTEVKGVCDQVKPSKVRMLYWDTSVCREEVYLQDELDNLTRSTKPAGGGGTDVRCVPKYMGEHGIKPECAIILTDGYLGGDWGTWTVPVLWVILNNKSARPTVGTAIYIDN
jgi:predicted metal-dependent peptidase